MSTFIDGDLDRGEAISLLTLQDVAIRGFAASWKAPRWIKIWRDGEPEPVMAWVNGAYARWYDMDPRGYIGKPDSAMWSADVCERFRVLDLEAIARAGEIVMDVEPTPRGEIQAVIARKFAFRVDSDDIRGWGIYGEICPLEIIRCESCPQEKNNNG